VVIRNSTGIVISNGGITDCGMSAFNVTGGSDCGLLNVDVVRCGTGGAVLEGGDRQTLTEANHFVRESRLRDSNRWVMNYAPLVLMAGVGQRVEGSVLSDAPQTAVFVQGNSHKLLNSTIRDVVQQCDDVRHFLLRLCSSCLLSFLLSVLYLPIMPCLPACSAGRTTSGATGRTEAWRSTTAPSSSRVQCGPSHGASSTLFTLMISARAYR
jgi:hypothetical protein